MYLPPRISAALLHTADRLRGRGVWDAWRRLDESQWWEPAQLAEHQARKLAHRVREAAATSPLWRERLQAAGVDAAAVRDTAALGRLPTLERADLQQRLDRLTPGDLRPGEASPNSTGGSSGTNVHFLVDRHCELQRDAVDLRLWSFLGLGPGCRVATVWGSPMDQSRARSWRERLGRGLGNLRFFSAYRLGDRDADRLLDWLARRRPDVLMGYASVLDLLAARALRRGGVAAARFVISSAEALFPDQRARIEKGLGAEVFNLYGCREVGLVALECATHRGLHVMDERLVAELAPGPEGEPADLLLTDLDNRATPFIRYRIGDMAVPAAPERCRCGRGLSRLKEISGRSFDVIRGPSGGAVGGTFWSLLLRTAVKGVLTYQVVQHQVDSLEIRFAPRDGLPEEDRETVRERIREALGREMRVEFSGHDVLEPLASGKHRFIVVAPAVAQAWREAGETAGGGRP